MGNRRDGSGARGIKRDGNGGTGAGPLAFDDVGFNALSRGFEGQAQRCCAGLPGCRLWAQYHEQGVGLLSKQMETAQGGGPGVVHPAQQGCTSVMFKYLFGGPEDIAGCLGANPQWPVAFELPVDPAVEARFVRRMNQGYAALGIEFCQRRPQQEDFADAGLGGHEFYEGAQGPALSGQFLVQRRKARPDGGLVRARKL